MSYDQSVLSGRFSPAATALERKYPIFCNIPDDREPEKGYLFERMETAYEIEHHLLSHPRITPFGGVQPHEGFLISVPQDTVDENGMPTNIIAANNLEKRRRFNLHTPATKGDSPYMERHDVSYKSAGKKNGRKEWEEEAASFQSIEAEWAAANKVIQDHPELIIIDPNSFRSLGTCVASRATSHFYYELENGLGALRIEAQKDACLLSSPHADILLGYRREKEIEAVYILLPKDTESDKALLNSMLDHGMDEIDTIIQSGNYSEKIHAALESKGAHTTRLSQEFYENSKQNPQWKRYNGMDVSLLQNVTIESFYGKLNSIVALARLIPSSEELAEATVGTHFDRTFQKSRFPNLKIVA